MTTKELLRIREFVIYVHKETNFYFQHITSFVYSNVKNDILWVCNFYDSNAGGISMPAGVISVLLVPVLSLPVITEQSSFCDSAPAF
jgi:hypothetical protein